MTAPLLTENQIAILKLVNEGKSNQEIADDQTKSKRTIDATLALIYKSLQVNNRISAIRKAQSLGLLD